MKKRLILWIILMLVVVGLASIGIWSYFNRFIISADQIQLNPKERAAMEEELPPIMTPGELRALKLAGQMRRHLERLEMEREMKKQQQKHLKRCQEILGKFLSNTANQQDREDFTYCTDVIDINLMEGLMTSMQEKHYQEKIKNTQQ